MTSNAGRAVAGFLVVSAILAAFFMGLAAGVDSRGPNRTVPSFDPGRIPTSVPR